MQVEQAHHQKSGRAARERHGKLRAHQQRKARFPGTKRQHDVEEIMDLGDAKQRQEAPRRFVREVIVDAIAANEIGCDKQHQSRDGGTEADLGPLPQQRRPSPEPFDEGRIGRNGTCRK
ncbi:hypothetical protein D9M72_492840 [compost metagenome]